MCQTNQSLESLNSEKILSAIETDNLSTLVALDIFESINSTNTYLLECARRGVSSGTICLAEQQTQGRGRQGRQWYSPRSGNICCSILWHFSADLKELSALSLAVAVMVADALKKYGIQQGVALKWPNDVLFEGKKLAGILLERVSLSEDVIGVVIGIGLNGKLPADASQVENATDITTIMGGMDRNYLVGLLINELLGQLKKFQQEGLDAFLSRWLELDAYVGKTISVRVGEDSIVGEMVGINNDGELLLKTQQGQVQAYRCGEVSVRVN